MPFTIRKSTAKQLIHVSNFHTHKPTYCNVGLQKVATLPPKACPNFVSYFSTYCLNRFVFDGRYQKYIKKNLFIYFLGWEGEGGGGAS